MSDLSRVLAALSEFGPTFDKANDNPIITDPVLKTAAADDANGSMPSLRRSLSEGDRILMQKELMKLESNELVHLFHEQMSKGNGRGVPVGADPYLASALGADPIISKVLDTTGGAALQRQDLEPILWAL